MSEMAEEFKGLEPMGDAPVATAPGIAAIALSMAMKYHDMGMVTDGALYQQYKLEGRNIREIGLADVFDTAIQIERHLLAANERIAALVVDAIEWKLEQEEEAPAPCDSSPQGGDPSGAPAEPASAVPASSGQAPVHPLPLPPQEDTP